LPSISNAVVGRDPSAQPTNGCHPIVNTFNSTGLPVAFAILTGG